MYLIVGLGNPEDKYAGTRHNLGFEVLDELRRKLNLGDWQKNKSLKSEIIKASFSLKAKNYQLILARPQTYVNLSGLAVTAIAKYFKISPEKIVVVNDELDLSLGHIKIRLGGAAAGHHGVESIIEKLGTDKFIRIRLGIGKQKTFSSEHKEISFNTEKYVLEPFTQKEKTDVKHMIKRAIRAMETLLDDGLEAAQNQFN